MYRDGDSSRPVHSTRVKLEELDRMGDHAASASSVYSQIKDLLFMDCSPSEFDEHDNGQQQQQLNSNCLWGFPDTNCSAALQIPTAISAAVPAPPPLLHPDDFTPALQIPKAPATGGTSKAVDHQAKAKRRSSSTSNNSKFSTDPQSVAARLRRKRISERFKILQKLVPGGTKMDTASMLDEAISYVKFLKQQISLHELVVNGTGGSSHGAAGTNEDQIPASSWSSSSVSEGGSSTDMAVELDFQHIQIMKIWNEQQ